MRLSDLRQGLLRRKQIKVNNLSSKLDRCLTTFDLTALGIGSTLGLGIYVLAGKVASEKAGPAVCLSFLFAAIASVFAGICYAEFGARVPKAGSAYIYSYVTMGEFVAFVIGWNLVLEYVIGTASVARGYSEYVDSIFNQAIQQTITSWFPVTQSTLFSAYPDVFALFITLLLTAMLAVGVKESTRFNSVFTGINLLVVVFVIAAGLTKSDIHNWRLNETEVQEGAQQNKITNYVGNGGFAPYGIAGIMAGAATCFYGFIGFDVIATTGEEVRKPQKAIPLSIVFSLLLIFLAYFGVSSVQTLMWPYYDQSRPAPIPYVFEKAGMPTARWIISVGALAGLSTSLLGAMFPLPRILYAMASDGLLFHSLSNVNERFKTPLIATIVSGLFAGLMAMIFNIEELADMMSIGTLLAYTLVAISVLILRYSSDAHNNCNFSTSPEEGFSKEKRTSGDTSVEFVSDADENLMKKLSSASDAQSFNITFTTITAQIINKNGIQRPNNFTSAFSVSIIIFISLIICLCDAILAFRLEALINGDLCLISILIVLTLILTISLLSLYCQPRNYEQLSFQVPLVPFLPFLSVMINIYLMLNLSVQTWKRFAIWMVIGLAIYIFYGFRNSTAKKNIEQGSLTEDSLVKQKLEELSSTP